MILECAQSSGLKNADATIYTGPCVLMGFKILADNTNAATVVFYDNTSAAGTVIGKGQVDATLVESTSDGIPAGGVICNNGIYADMTGTGAEYIVYFRPGN